MIGIMAIISTILLWEFYPAFAAIAVCVGMYAARGWDGSLMEAVTGWVLLGVLGFVGYALWVGY